MILNLLRTLSLVIGFLPLYLATQLPAQETISNEATPFEIVSRAPFEIVSKLFRKGHAKLF